MANGSKQKTSPARHGVTASGIVEAVEQDLELSMEQVKAAAKEAVAAVEEKLGVRKPPPRAHKPARKQKPAAKAAKTIKSRVAKSAKRSKEKKLK